MYDVEVAVVVVGVLSSPRADDRHPGPCDCGDLRRPNWRLMRQLAGLYLQVSSSSSSSSSLLLPLPFLIVFFFLLCFFAFLRRLRPEGRRLPGGHEVAAGLLGLPVVRASLCTQLPARRVPSAGFIRLVFFLVGHL